jgi:hypothetical protein
MNMKTTKISMLALAVLSGGILAASAAPAPVVWTAYTLDASFTNSTVDVWNVFGGPFTTNVASAATPEFPSSLTVATDGSGKITGAGILAILDNTTGTPLSGFNVTLTGKISSTVATAGTPTVSVTVKGNGYTVNSNGVATAASILVKFNSSGAGDSVTSRIPGTLGGLIKGITPGKVNSQLIIAQPAFVRATSVPTLTFASEVVQSSKGAIVLFSSAVTGTGTVTKGTNYVVTANGTGLNSAFSLTVKGVEGSYTNNAFGSTNLIVFSAPKTAIITKGKSKGQAIFSPAASSLNATLVTGD